jgi:hypothetical protein
MVLLPMLLEMFLILLSCRLQSISWSIPLSTWTSLHYHCLCM